MGLSREQMIYKGWSLLLRANGQWANGPLISNEQFGLGGVAGPRGYLDGEAYGDSGWRVQIEPRTPLINLGMVDNTAPFWVRGSVYMDYGELYRDGIPGVPHVRQHYCGVGMGVTATIGDHFDAKLAFGWPLLDGQNVKRGEGHVYFSIGAQF
jgi:hemolysin activation/secretion protein